jgi:Flp pilus assembly protein TadB
MEEELPPDAHGTERREPASAIPPLPPEVASGQEEVRRLVDAGAASPEELRALAARLREQREQEESAWRREVRPALIQAKKARVRLPDIRSGEGSAEGNLAVGLAVACAVIVLLFIATVTSFWVLLLAVAGVLAFAYRQGREP